MSGLGLFDNLSQSHGTCQCTKKGFDLQFLYYFEYLDEISQKMIEVMVLLHQGECANKCERIRKK